jgi:hypothetical protein
VQQERYVIPDNPFYPIPNQPESKDDPPAERHTTTITVTTIAITNNKQQTTKPIEFLRDPKSFTVPIEISSSMSTPATITTADSLTPIAPPDASASTSPSSSSSSSTGGKGGSGGKAYGTIPIIQDAWAVPVEVQEATVVPLIAANNNNNNNNNHQQYHAFLPPNHPTTTTTTTSHHHQVRILRVTTERRGQSCCGFCCDMRRAVVLLNGFLIVLYSIGLSNTLPWSSSSSSSSSHDRHQNDNDDTGRFLLMLLKLLCFVLGLWGALSFSTWQLYFPMVVHLYTIVVSGGIFSDWDWVPIGIGIVFLYPHVVLVQEIQNGILTKETYPFEAQSCCGCV